MFATSLALIAQEFPPNERGTAIGLWGATTGFAVAVGPLVGGVLTERPRLGVDLLRERAGRADDDRHDALRACRRASATPAHASTGRALVTFSGGALLPRAGADPGQRRGLGERADRGPAGRERCAAGGVRRDRAALRAADARPPPVPDPGLHRARRSPPSRCTRRCSRCSSTSCSTCRTSSATRRSRPACASCPSRCSSFVVAPVAGKLVERLPVRGFLGAGLRTGGRRPPADGRHRARRRLDHAAAGFILAGIGIGCVNPPLATAAIGVVEPRRSGAASGSTARSGRWASPPASPGWARCSRRA